MNTRYHSTEVNGFAVQGDPHTVWKNIFDVDPPITIRATHVPPERYMIGNVARNFDSLSPAVLYSENASSFEKVLVWG